MDARVRDIQDDGAAMLLQRIVGRRVVGTMVRPRERPLRFRSLTPELAHEFQVAVVAIFRIAAKAFCCVVSPCRSPSALSPGPQFALGSGLVQGTGSRVTADPVEAESNKPVT